jgi:hypothetical protein
MEEILEQLEGIEFSSRQEWERYQDDHQADWNLDLGQMERINEYRREVFGIPLYPPGGDPPYMSSKIVEEDQSEPDPNQQTVAPPETNDNDNEAIIVIEPES